MHLCIWHVHWAWIKFHIAIIKDNVPRQKIFKYFNEIMHTSLDEDVANASTIKLLEEHKEKVAFVKYFIDHWLGRIGMWEKYCYIMAHVGQEINRSIELYHSHLKSIWLKSICVAVHRRVDWLVYTLIVIMYIHY